MTYDTPIKTTSLSLTLEEREEAIAQERAALSRMRPQVVDPRLEQTIDIELLAVQRMLDLSRFKRLLSIQPKEYGQLTAVEQRNLLRAADGFRKRFDEISTWMGRNAKAVPDAPAFLKATG